MSKLRLSNSNKSIVLVGHMGSGKSTIGKNLSKKLGIDFFDSDKEIELREKIKISNIFSLHGEKYFRNLEEKINLKLLKYKNVVLALGGGAFQNPSVRKVALEKCNCIWLKCSLNLLEQRCNFKKRSGQSTFFAAEPTKIECGSDPGRYAFGKWRDII